MDFRGHKDTSFSPYHDDGRLIDFLDDDAQRFTVNAAFVFFLHVGLAFALAGSFVVPDLKPPPPPEAVTVEIVTFDPVKPEPEPEPIVVEPKPAAPPPAPQPKPKPKPQPRPEPEPTPPPPVIEPEPLPEPEPVLTPPPPEILVQPEPEPEPDPLDPVIPEPEPLPEPEVVEPIELEPIIEIFEPLPEPIIEPEVPESEPIIEFFEPEPEIIPEIIEEPLPVIEDLPPTPGVIEAEPLPEIIEPDPLPPEIILEPEPEIIPDPVLVEPAPAEPEFIEPEIIPTAPTVLASPDAPDTREEERRAVPQEQSDPFLDLLKRDRDSSLPSPNLGGPAIGGGNEGPIGSTTAPPGGGTQLGRPNPGAGGWTLAPQPTGPGKAYEGLNLDMRCREEGRTHEDCPEYLQKNRGRAADGSESFNGMAGTGSDRGNRISDSRSIPSTRSLGLPIGDNSFNNGGPSTGALDFQDTNFDREFLGKELYQLERERGLTDQIFNPIDPAKTQPDWTLDPPIEETDESDIDWALEKLPE